MIADVCDCGVDLFDGSCFETFWMRIRPTSSSVLGAMASRDAVSASLGSLGEMTRMNLASVEHARYTSPLISLASYCGNELCVDVADC